ncbi:hypothetical protein [Salipiger thiooxidans]|uniref:hypothetical protein n=1 Tax=Salipiger thiooxidans TaxID=282683 RepID=UPI0021E5CCD3|nr:hypothetical protein [Salipiger thiooxidans]
MLASGLAIIFGMMRVINFAHGEFLMLGGYITVITGGASMIAGTLSASTLLGTISQGMTFATGPVYGDAALLLAALVLLRVLPQGITGRIFKKSL